MTDDLIMNGPIQLKMKVWIVNEESGQTGQVTYTLPNFRHLDGPAMKVAIGKAMKQIESQGIEGFRVATKRETWDFVCEEEAGQTFALPGGDGWDD